MQAITPSPPSALRIQDLQSVIQAVWLCLCMPSYSPTYSYKCIKTGISSTAWGYPADTLAYLFKNCTFIGDCCLTSDPLCQDHHHVSSVLVESCSLIKWDFCIGANMKDICSVRKCFFTPRVTTGHPRTGQCWSLWRIIQVRSFHLKRRSFYIYRFLWF